VTHLATPDVDRRDLEAQLERQRAPLTGYCYRMLGSAFEADDAVQETYVRAWRGYGRFEGRSSLRSWFYRIATNVCLDMLAGRGRRALPMDLVPATRDIGATTWGYDPALPEATWIRPVPDSRVVAPDADPAEAAATRETIRLAFVAALQHLAPRPRAVLILRDVLGWHADEVAELLDLTPTAVHSSLQRARRVIAERTAGAGPTSPPLDEADRALLARYVDAFERYDIESLVALLHEDATMSMPPLPLWLRGPEAIERWWHGPGTRCRGTRLVATAANGSAAFGLYRPADSGRHEPFGVQVVEIGGGLITGIHSFIDAALFPLFRLPERVDTAA
jgi:RNA polymerase sigma-70 factor (ECF subfamily)